ncbi:MAG: ATP-dependent 6-phosphofructokinase [Eubacteriales bacterium]|nr:ATP-dependent 6-phosphofructokinase [Eubacteriales bacterium]MDD3882819.1 ATP-dependent 6-phosphofructokinase [Eubacteriales bacterium]MDD4513283.1 ATP-dependent 6-phosphofructokinase [Eubacteriales bacterium]
MKRRIGILTSGGDCPGLNAAIRGVAKAAYQMFDAEIVGIKDGYGGLIDGEWREMKQSDFSGILTLGGTILGTSRQPFRNMRVIGEDNVDKVSAMKKNYKAMKLDCLITLGGNGTHKTSNMLSEEGLNVIGLPKTIDNDLFGTDFTFGFHTAVDIATDVIDRIHTTACSHGRCMVIELMGNKAGWLTLYAGLAGGADVILLPEIPYDVDRVLSIVEDRAKENKAFSIIAVAEGAMSKEEAKMKRKDRDLQRQQEGFTSISARLANDLQQKVGVEARTVIPGHLQRGGTPSAYDRVLATQFGVHAAELIRDGVYGVSVAISGNAITHNALKDIAGVPKLVPPDHQMVQLARAMGLHFGVKR